MQEKEQRIKELRTLEANKKNYMGMSGKFGAILKAFGEPIIKQTTSGGWYDSSYLDDAAALEKEDPRNADELLDYIPSADREQRPSPTGGEWHERESEVYGTSIIGYRYDGLNNGSFLEIVFWEVDSKIRVNYRGYTVYQEIMGDLERFVPFDEWEQKIERLFSQAKENLLKEKEQYIQEKKILEQKEKAEWLIKMKEIWGL